MSSAEIGTLKQAFEAAGGHWSTFVIWAKNAFTLGRSDYQRQYEPILYGWPKGSDHYWCGARDQGDVWQHDRPARNDLHPTMKPIGAGGAGDPQLVQDTGHGARPVRRVRHHADGGGGDRPDGGAGRARPRLLRRHRAALAGGDGRHGCAAGRGGVRRPPAGAGARARTGRPTADERDGGGGVISWFRFVRHAEVATYERQGWIVVADLGPVHGA